jgi:hypothetical protein
MDWGRDGRLFGTFLHYNSSRTVASVFTAQTTAPTNPAAWTYETSAGTALTTNLPAFVYSDQPWLGSGPTPADPLATSVAVAYDNFNISYTNVEARAATSPGHDPIAFDRDAPEHVDGQRFNGTMNPGNRLAVGPDGTIWNVHQRVVTDTGTVKQLVYLVNASFDGGQTFAIGNSNHASGARTVTGNRLQLSGERREDRRCQRAAGRHRRDHRGLRHRKCMDRLRRAQHPVRRRPVVPRAGDEDREQPDRRHAARDLTRHHWVVPAFGCRSPQRRSRGAVHHPQRLDLLVDARSDDRWGCNPGQVHHPDVVHLAFPEQRSLEPADPRRLRPATRGRVRVLRRLPRARGGVNSVNSIDPYFLRATAFAACTPPAIAALAPAAVCAGAATFSLGLQGSGFTNGAVARAAGSLRDTTYVSPASVTMEVRASDVASPGPVPIDLIGAVPAGGRTNTLALIAEAPASSPGASLAGSRTVTDVQLDWDASAGATGYSVLRCTATAGACAPMPIASPATNSYLDPVVADSDSYWYLVAATNSCGAVP